MQTVVWASLDSVLDLNLMEQSMKKAFQWLRRLQDAVAFPLAVLMSSPVLAALPTPSPPSTAPASGDWLGLIKGYIKDGGVVMGLAVAVAAFVWAAWAAIAKFNEARNGRAEWGEVGLLAVVAGGILIFDSYLLGTAAGII